MARKAEKVVDAAMVRCDIIRGGIVALTLVKAVRKSLNMYADTYHPA